MKKLLRNLLFLTIVLVSFQTVCFAKVGDVIGIAQHTSIVAYINNHAIPSYAVNGQSCIVAEDLANYGFDVRWDSRAMALYITQSSNYSVKEIEFSKTEESGSKFADILETEVKVYANNKRVTSYAINGYTMIPMEELTMFGSVQWLPDEAALKMWVESVSLNKSTLSMTVGDTETLSATILPNNTTVDDVDWKSSNVATVDKGIIKAVGEGTVVITATTANRKTAKCEISVTIQWYSSSMYRVGTDIPAGDYYAVATKSGYSGYYCKYTDSTQDDIEDNDNFENFTFFRCYDGQYLKLSSCKITPIKNAPTYSSADGVYGEGTYRVGIDIPAGEYKFTATERKYSGYYCVYTDITYEDIEDNDNFDDVAYYTINNGQYLEISRATAQKIGDGATTNKNTSGSSSNTTSYSGYGQVKGEITWKYNKVLGTRGDDGAYVMLIPDNGSVKDYDNKLATMLISGTYDSGIIVTKCDGYGRFDFGDKVPAGKYKCVVISNNTTSSSRFNNKEAWMEKIEDEFGKYFSDEDLDTFKLFIGYQKIATSIIEVERKTCTTITKDFGYTYI